MEKIFLEKKQLFYSKAQNYLDNERSQMLDDIFQLVCEPYCSHFNKIQATYLDEVFDLLDILTNDIILGFSSFVSVIVFRSKALDSDIFEKSLKFLKPEIKSQVENLVNSIYNVSKYDINSIFSLTAEQYLQKIDILPKRSKKFVKSYEEYLSEQGDLFKQFMLSISQDIRVVLMKLAYNVYKMRNIAKYDDEQKFIIANQSRYIFAPIAHQLGLYHVKSFLEELAMQILNPNEYNYIKNILAQTQEQREKYIQDFIKPVKKSLEEINIQAEVKGRPKSIHSIWRKMVKQNVGIDKIYDLFAIRIIILNEFKNLSEEKEACWQVYSKITDVWKPNPDRLKDWVSAPKASGYESLHTTVIGPEGKWVEVQIRTKRMDEKAEKGEAAHWKYKEVKGQGLDIDWLNAIRSILENPLNAQEEDFVKKELYSDTIFVYTPKNELVKLPNGSTVLDFAYKLHTDIGFHCIGAKIQNKVVGIRHLLKNGDVVEVLVSKNQFPRQEWLDFVVTKHAKVRIKRDLNKLQAEQIEAGKKIILELFDKMKQKFKKPDFVVDNKILNLVKKKFNYERINDFFLDLYHQKIQITEDFIYNNFVLPLETTYENIIKRLEDQLIVSDREDDHSDVLVIDNSLDSIKYEFAKCCNPIFGDKIFAYISATSGTKIHKIDCPNAPELIRKFPYRVLPAKWRKTAEKQKFKAKIFVSSKQSPGIIAKISEHIANMGGVDLFEISIKPTNSQTYEGTVGVFVDDVDKLNSLINKIRQVDGVLSVWRAR